MTLPELGTNPFPPSDADRHEIWDMLVRRDIAAFTACDWDAHSADFAAEAFWALDAQSRSNPDGWNLVPRQAYAQSWKDSALGYANRIAPDALGRALHAATQLRDIDVCGDTAIAHKKFDGWLDLGNGDRERLNWQTLYLCRKAEGRWWINGFVGYLPNPLGAEAPTGRAPGKTAPTSTQHVTAGPYSPVLSVQPGQLVVISGQAALEESGRVIGSEIREQSRVTLENCRTQLQAAGCGFEDVFKVNVYMADLADWPAFNEVYRALMPEPLPVRTAIGAKLLATFLVEIEMWAVKP